LTSEQMADALMFKVPRKGDRRPPRFITPDSSKIEYWRWLGWVLLASEPDVRAAARDKDIDDTRREDESQGRR
jgi:hypothetical protein